MANLSLMSTGSGGCARRHYTYGRDDTIRWSYRISTVNESRNDIPIGKYSGRRVVEEYGEGICPWPSNMNLISDL